MELVGFSCASIVYSSQEHHKIRHMFIMYPRKAYTDPVSLKNLHQCTFNHDDRRDHSSRGLESLSVDFKSRMSVYITYISYKN